MLNLRRHKRLKYAQHIDGKLFVIEECLYCLVHARRHGRWPGDRARACSRTEGGSGAPSRITLDDAATDGAADSLLALAERLAAAGRARSRMAMTADRWF